MATVPVAFSSAEKSRYAANLMRHMRVLAQLPEAYQGIPRAEREERTAAALEALGDSTLLLAHNYQNDEVAQWAHATGDSYQLSVRAAEATAEHIVFCGVSFMAETADLLTRGERNVILPSMEASCPMAGMAEMVQVAEAWEQMAGVVGADGLLPVTYMNSYADLKGFTGERGGLICTSSNAHKALEWAFDQGKTVVFLPDKHLGENTAVKLGVHDDEMVRWNPWSRDFGGTTAEALERARIVLWEGMCQVHERFNLEHVAEARREHPGVDVVVHPECRRSVVEAADFVGSTAQIADYVEGRPAGSKLAIGTEIHMVRRLAKEHPDKTIVQLCGDACLDCNAMRQIQPDYLLWVLEELVAGRVVNRVRVDDADRPGALKALERMLAL